MYVEAQGTGPVLLLIPGGPADGTVFTAMLPALSSRYRVVTYDPRGLYRSTIDDGGDIAVQRHSDDAYRVLDSVTSDPALIFASCGGAITALDLIATHPGRVRALIAHEPPLLELLPDKARQHAAISSLCEVAQNHGAQEAMLRLIAHFGWEEDRRLSHSQPRPRASATNAARRGNNIELLFTRMLRPMTKYRPNHVALRSAAATIIVASGTDSAGQLAYRTTQTLAGELGTTIRHYPGGHGGFIQQPQHFAAKLITDLAEAVAPN
ncbi:alpha/beta fold hydrolase [Amycolatopsis sp. VS8301801F10]|uniref:alpha/beta fold hydrolase n=1 Tax=Amycolatopsis sp. VS8301801F10 TaxID=2652442 RepID=UPI0038FC51B0